MSQNDPTIYVPVNPQTKAVSGTAASFNTLKQPYYTLIATVDIFYRVDGTTATVDGNASHFLIANQPIDLYSDGSGAVSVISAAGTTGSAYITEWLAK